MLSLRLPPGARRGLAAVVCAMLITPAAAHADPSGEPRGPTGPTTPGTVRGRAGTGVLGVNPTATPSRLSRAEVDRQIKAAEQQLEMVVEDYDALGVRLAATQQQSAAIASSLVPLRRQVAALQDRVGQIAAGLYMYRQARLATMLAAGSPLAALEQLTLAANLAHQEQAQVDALHAAQAGYGARNQELDALSSRQAGQRTALAAQRSTIMARIAALREMRAAAGSAWAPLRPLPALPVPVSARGSAGRAMVFALTQLGRPYSFGAAGPSAYDCSGLVMAAWAAAGVSLPHNAAAQWRVIAHVSRDDLRPGDLVFYFSDIHHVGMYVGNDRIVHAPTYGLDVMISPIGIEPIYGYGRPG